jgi:hypothetical protein
MAGRGKLTIEGLAASKEGPTVIVDGEEVPFERLPVKRPQGGQRKVDKDRLIGQTLRLPLPLWQALRQAVEIEEMHRPSGSARRVLGSHIIEEALRTHLERKYRIEVPKREEPTPKKRGSKVL